MKHAQSCTVNIVEDRGKITRVTCGRKVEIPQDEKERNRYAKRDFSNAVREYYEQLGHAFVYIPNTETFYEGCLHRTGEDPITMQRFPVDSGQYW